MNALDGLQLFDVGTKRESFLHTSNRVKNTNISQGVLLHPNALRVGMFIHNRFNTPLYVMFDEEFPRTESDGYVLFDLILDPGAGFYEYPADFRIAYKGKVTYYAENAVSGLVIAGERFIREGFQQL